MCTIDNCDRKIKARGLCSKHYKRWLRTGNPSVKTQPNFKGDNAGYLAIHVRLRKTRGRASQYICTLCENRAEEWSYDKDDPNEKTDTVSGLVVKFSTDLNHYVPMCASCHRKFDKRL